MNFRYLSSLKFQVSSTRANADSRSRKFLAFLSLCRVQKTPESSPSSRHAIPEKGGGGMATCAFLYLYDGPGHD